MQEIELPGKRPKETECHVQPSCIPCTRLKQLALVGAVPVYSYNKVVTVLFGPFQDIQMPYVKKVERAAKVTYDRLTVFLHCS